MTGLALAPNACTGQGEPEAQLAQLLVLSDWARYALAGNIRCVARCIRKLREGALAHASHTRALEHCGPCSYAVSHHAIHHRPYSMMYVVCDVPVCWEAHQESGFRRQPNILSCNRGRACAKSRHAIHHRPYSLGTAGGRACAQGGGGPGPRAPSAARSRIK